MKIVLKMLMISVLLLSASSIMFSGCAAKSYSKGFDEAD